MLLIGQLEYATTLKYNFPNPPTVSTLKELQIPQRFIKLSLASMQSAKGRYLQIQSENLPTPIIAGDHSEIEEPIPMNISSVSARLMPLKPLQDETPIIAVDVSSVRLGETDVGILCAVRGAIVWSVQRKYGYLRIGPFPFHITEENSREVMSLLRFYRFFPSGLGSPRLEDMQVRLCNLVERWLQMSICSSSYGSIILWDGSLTAGTTDSPLTLIRRILEEAKNRLNTVLAFSKVTGIRVLGRRMTDLVLKYPPPCLFKMDELPHSTSGSLRLLGNVYIAKLAWGLSAFRLDIDRRVREEEGLRALRRLLGNDILYQGYPETLRLAHILSTFTASEVIGIQRFVAQRYNLRIVVRPSVRRTLFGPFGTRFEN